MDNNLIERYKKELIDTYNKVKTQNTISSEEDYGSSGKLIVSVTTLSGLYPVPRASVTVFTGDMDNMNVIDTDITDISGKTKAFLLPAPDKAPSLSAGATEEIYESYNVLVRADGYVDEINYNLPVFRGVTSLQNVDLVLRSVSFSDSPTINDQFENYNL